MTSPDDAMLREAATIAAGVARRYLMTDRRGEAVTPDDVAQDVLIAFLRQDVDTLENWRAWVNRAARNRAIDVVRSGPGRERAARRRDLRATGRAARRRPQCRSASGTRSSGCSWRRSPTAIGSCSLAHVDGASHAELARDFGLADAASVATTLTRIRRKVRDAFPDRADVLELLGPPPRVYDVDNRGRRG